MRNLGRQRIVTDEQPAVGAATNIQLNGIGTQSSRQFEGGDGVLR